MDVASTSLVNLVENLHRTQSTRLIAALTRLLHSRNLGVVENIVQDCFVAALRTWEDQGLPASPEAWLMTTAKNRAVDWLRREARGFDSVSAKDDVVLLDAPPRRAAGGLRNEPEDDRLCMMFVTCHPELNFEAQLTLTLHSLCDLTNTELARALLVEVPVLEKRLVRARRRLRDIAPPFELPEAKEMESRLDAVLRVLYLLFSEGYSAHAGEHPVRLELCAEALRLCELLLDCPALRAPRLHALYALMCLQASRTGARFDELGDVVTLDLQDRTLWDKRLIGQGFSHLELSARGDRPSAYHLEAGIAACHAVAPSFEQTDWARIVGYYDALLRSNPSPVIALNRAVARALGGEPEAALSEIRKLQTDARLRRYAPLKAAAAELLHNAGNAQLAGRAYREALQDAATDAERRFLERRMAELVG